MKNAVILMTALVPTTGHADLISFAAHLPATNVWVLINSRSWEPYAGRRRLEAVSQHFNATPNVIVRLAEQDEAPQNPPDHHDFWNWWKDAINEAFPEVSSWDYVVASEPYGKDVADSLGACFMPYDVGRALNPIVGRVARADLWASWDKLLPLVRQDFQLRAVLFGQESVGKTTVSRLVAEQLKCQWLFEYARPYQETMGPVVDQQVMASIHAGQYALQTRAYGEARSPALIMDTDLYSTVGYHPLMESSPPNSLLQDARNTAAHVYYLMHDGVPFEPDVFRYGGDQRESSRAYWADLLAKENLPTVWVPLGSPDEQATFIAQDAKARFRAQTQELEKFLRD